METISIHAPAGGASIDANADMIVQQFQFTPLREGLHAFALASSLFSQFQFTPLREGLLRFRLRQNFLFLFQFTVCDE